MKICGFIKSQYGNAPFKLAKPGKTRYIHPKKNTIEAGGAS